MGIRRPKTGAELGEHRIFGDEEAAAVRAELDELRSQFVALAERVNAQFTSIAAHAEIAREQVCVAREEARSDMERTRETLIGLIETVRAEASGLHVAGAAPGASVASAHERVAGVEAAVASLQLTVEELALRQVRMGDTMAAFIDTMLAETRGEPVAGLALG
ncbi:MAG: hypothetical protein CL424_06370 [Acidimicrobiaceae bacterium]|nr:hypothetical protein [Acidimicrobiaceae bacterium]